MAEPSVDPAPADRPRLSVLIPTFHRDDRLLALLRALADNTVDRRDWEVVVVDNAASDSARRTVEGASSVYPVPLRYLAEPRPGVAHARNTAVQAAHGELLAFIDDDALPVGDWVAGVIGFFDRYPARIGGGRVDIDWETPRPEWLGPQFLARLGQLRHSPITRPLAPGQWLNGANLWFRADVLVGEQFDVSLGRRGRKLGSNEESDLVQRLVGRGEAAMFSPWIIVSHAVEPRHVRVPYLLRKAFGQAMSDALVQARNDPAQLRPALASHVARLRGRSTGAVARRGRAGAVLVADDASWVLGYLAGIARAHTHRHPPIASTSVRQQPPTDSTAVQPATGSVAST